MAPPYTPSVLIVQERNYVVEKSLGEGAFGKVYKVREDGGSGGVYALKKIEVENSEAVNMVKREIGILAKCNHDHIVRLYRVDTTRISRSTYILILMEYCEGGNLNSRLAKPSDNGTNLRWMKELADAMNYLHSSNVVHRDLKPENVLLTVNGSIKLGDFGLAREFAVLRQSHAQRSDEALVSYLNQVYMDTAVGTRAWMAPEVFTGHYTQSADIFALATILYAILTRACMSAGGKKYYGAFVSVGGQKIGLGMAMTRNPNAMVPLDGCPSRTRQVLRSMLDYNYKNRPSARKVFEKMNSILELDDATPNPQREYPTENLQPYQQGPFPVPQRAPSPIPNFIPPAPSPYRQSPLPRNKPHYRQAQQSHPQHSPPPPRFGSPSPTIPTPQSMRGIFRMNARPSQRSPFLNPPTHGAPMGHVPAHAPRPTFIRSPVHVRMHSPVNVRMHTPTRITGSPRHFSPSPRHMPHRFR